MASCAGCGSELEPPRGRKPRKWCSERCRRRANYPTRRALGLEHAPRSTVSFVHCVICGELFCGRRRDSKTCSEDCAAERNRRRYRDYFETNRETELRRHVERRANASIEERLQNLARNQRRRAVIYDADAESFNAYEIYERDGWICGICQTPIDQNLRFPHPGSASLDHVTPLSRGGRHTRANTRASHLHCNCSRGNRDEPPISPDMGLCVPTREDDDGWTRTCTEGPRSPSRALS